MIGGMIQQITQAVSLSYQMPGDPQVNTSLV